MRDCTEQHGSSWANFHALRGTPPTKTLLFLVTAITWNLQNQNALACTSWAPLIVTRKIWETAIGAFLSSRLVLFPNEMHCTKPPHTWNTCVGSMDNKNKQTDRHYYCVYYIECCDRKINDKIKTYQSHTISTTCDCSWYHIVLERVLTVLVIVISRLDQLFAFNNTVICGNENHVQRFVVFV